MRVRAVLRGWGSCGLLVWVAGCATTSARPATAPGDPAAGAEPQIAAGTDVGESPEQAPVSAGGPATAAALPPIPMADGPLELVVRYPARLQRIEPDSNFLFGTTGSGAATLEIDGVPVPVEPNGAFLAWLPTPAAARGDTARYRLVAVADGRRVVLEHPVRRPAVAPPPGARSPWIDPAGLRSPAERWVLPGETIELELVVERGAEVRLEAGELRIPAPLAGPARGSLDRHRARIDAEALRDAACRAGRCRARLPGRRGSAADAALAGVGTRLDTLLVDVIAARDGREQRAELRLPLAVLPLKAGLAARLREAPDSINGASGVVVARPTPFGPYRWRLAEGTVVPVTGRVADRLRVRLAADLAAWVLAEDAAWVADPGGPAETWDARFLAGAEPDAPIALRVGITRPAAAEARVTGPRAISLTLYDTYGGLDRIAHGASSGVSDVSWRQLPGPITRLDIELERPVWGYRLSLEAGEAADYEGPRSGRSPEAAAGATSAPAILRLDIRFAPSIDAEQPLRGRRIAIDPGHPGGGSYGPTGLYEGDANLAIARQLEALLRERGAEPILVRRDEGPVGLYERTRRAREAAAEIFVSIHNNALPDGVRPFERAGTGTYYHHPHSAALARHVQSGMVARMGLRDLGVLWGDLAVAREPWMPSVLAEGAFMMVPAHEAALREPAFQRRYAEGVLDGIERFLAEARDRAEGAPAERSR